MRVCVLPFLLSCCIACEPNASLAPDAGLMDAVAPTDLQPAEDAGDPRQALRDRSLLANGSFEVVDAYGDLTGWTCSYGGEGAPPTPLCELITDASPDGTRFLRLAPNVAAFADITGFVPDGYVWYDLLARRGSGIKLHDFYLVGYSDPSDLGTVLWSSFPRISDDGPGGWTHVQSLTRPLAGSAHLRMIAHNTSGEDPLDVDDFVVAVETRPTASGHLLRAEHGSGFRCAAGTEPAVVYVPLPLLHGVQTPLHVELSVDPPEVADVSYVVDDIGNLGARLTIAPDAAFSTATIRWQGVAMTREAALEELGGLYAPTSDPSPWLAATPVVDASCSGIADAAAQLTAGLVDPGDRMAAILGWTSTWITNEGQTLSLDATAAYETRNGPCTAFANLGAAVGRAAGLPTRTIANYFVGVAQATHYIDEFYLDATRGWRLVEPQATSLSLPADYAFLIRQDRIADEGADSMQALHGWAAPGVPERSLVEGIEGTSRCRSLWLDPPPFAECSSCDNKATYQAPLKEEAARVAAAFEHARTLWQRTLTRLVTTGPDADELGIRRRFLDARDLADVEALLAELDALP
jgi:hypothetical protein